MISLAFLAMLQFIEQGEGGAFIWVLLGLAFVGTLIVLERVIFFQRTKIHVGDLMMGLSNHLKKGAPADALREAARAPGSVARVAHATLMRHYSPRTDLRDIAQEAGQLEVPRIEKNMRGLYAIALIAPLVGMLGTVSGLIQMFSAMRETGSFSSNANIAEGIYQSLITTGLGLLVAVPAYIFYLYLVGRAKRLVHRIERGAIEIVNVICDAREQKEQAPLKPSTKKPKAKRTNKEEPAKEAEPEKKTNAKSEKKSK